MKRSAANWIELALIVIALMFALAVMAALIAAPTRSQTPDHFSSEHWYDAACCSRRDCEALPPEAVEDVRGGWHVRYIAKMGLAVDVFVATGKDRPSQDGRFHGCATSDRFLCLYTPRVS